MIIRYITFATIILSPLFACAYFVFVVLSPTPKTQQQILAEQLSQRCRVEWEVLQRQSFSKYGVRFYGDAPEYCNDFQRNLKIYKVQ